MLLLQGISLINGTQLITGLGVEALSRAELIAKQADVVAALTLDVLQGTPRAFDYGKCKHTTVHLRNNTLVGDRSNTNPEYSIFSVVSFTKGTLTSCES